MTEQKEDILPPVSVDPSLAPGIGLPQSPIGPQCSKRSRQAVPLELVSVKEPRITQFNLSTQTVPANRLPHQRQVKGTNFFGDLIQANSVQQLATSRLVGLSQSRPRARSPGLATSTRPDHNARISSWSLFLTSHPQSVLFLNNSHSLSQRPCCPEIVWYLQVFS